MADYQPFPITTLKTGLFTYLQPWIRPEEAFQPLENAQVYRGQLAKRYGYIQLGNQLADHNPVMGIMRYQNEMNGNELLVVATTTNAYVYNGTTFSPLTAVGGSASVFWQGVVVNATGSPVVVTIPSSGSIPTFWTNLSPSSITITAFNGSSNVGTVTDNGSGGWTGATGIFTNTGTVNYVNGQVVLTITAAPTTTYNLSLNITATLVTPTSTPGVGAYFSGNISNFFNWTNWEASIDAVSYLYFTNNVDPVTLFDGTSLSRPIFYVDNAFTTYIKTALDVNVFRNRLLMVLPTISTETNPQNQSIYWSAQFNPFDFINNIAGHGGFLAASTGDIIQSFNFLRDLCIIRFTKSVWIFRFTGNDFNPFFFAKINSTKRTSCPYASIEYDERETGIGSTGITACDGVNVQRFDTGIIDFYETEFSQQYFSQAFSQRYDNNSESWTLFCSQANLNPVVGGVAPGSDKALIFNFIENTWATHVFTIPLTCLGIYSSSTGKTWAAASDTWEEDDTTWFSYTNQKNAIQLLAGDTTGNVWWMDNENANTDNGTAIIANIYSTRWNPFIQVGQKVQFGYIDFYYSRQPDCVLNLTFFIDNSETPCATRTLTLDANGTDGNANSGYAMKRIFINAMGEFLQLQIQSSSESYFEINGLILWARPAGRLTP